MWPQRALRDPGRCSWAPLLGTWDHTECRGGRAMTTGGPHMFPLEGRLNPRARGLPKLSYVSVIWNEAQSWGLQGGPWHARRQWPEFCTETELQVGISGRTPCLHQCWECGRRQRGPQPRAEDFHQQWKKPGQDLKLTNKPNWKQQGDLL